MRNTGVLCLAALLLAIPAGAQTKTGGKLHCAKPDADQSIEVGDKPGHVVYARKSACTWDGSQEIEGLKTKTGVDVATGEVNGTTMRDSGYHTATMDNGDKYMVRFNGATAMAKDSNGTIEGKWTFVSGTGKLKGIKGAGTYKGTANADGSADVTVDGEYTLAPPPPAKKK
ncbi:MAG TPA: hypothetical protein VGI12_01560 [Vicinamibacterales bacterium]|jgi:hypothetical protein